MADASGLVAIRHGQVTKVGWVPPTAEMSSQQWLEIGKVIAGFDLSMRWIIGDWWAYGADRKYGDGEALAEAVGLDYGTVRNCASVSRSFELSQRYDNLSHNHHQLVAGRDDRDDWLRKAIAGTVNERTGKFKQWSVKDLKDAVKAHDKAERDQGSAVAPWTAEPDTTPPRVTWVYPSDGATGLALTSRFGLSFNEMVDPGSAWVGSIRLYRADLSPDEGRVDGYVSAQENIVNFWPAEPLAPNTQYTFEVPAGGIVDFNGNPIAEPFTATFTTGL